MALKPKPQDFIFWTTPGGQVVQTQVDTVPTWTDSREATVTENPVEDGSVVTSHISLIPPTLTVTAEVSQTPLYGGELEPLNRTVPASKFHAGGLFALTQAVSGAIDAAVVAIGGALGFGGGGSDRGLRTFQFSDQTSDPGNDFHDKLIQAQEDGLLVSVALGVNRNSERLYEGYAITRVVKTISSDDGEKSVFEIELKKMSIVQTEIASLPIPTPLEAAKSLAASVTQGKKSATIRDDPETDAQKSKQLSSMLVSIID